MYSTIKIAIVILNYNGLKDTLECLESLYQMDYKDFICIVIDNNSKIDPKNELMNRFPQICFIQNSENLGFAQGCNIGIKKGLDLKADYILLLNNDTKVDKKMLSSFIKGIKEKPDVGIFGGKILRYDTPSIIDHFGGFFSKEKGDFRSIGSGAIVDQFSSDMKVEYVCGCLMLIKKEVFETIGFLEKDFFLLWEEADFANRALKAHFEIWALADVKVWHKISVSFEGGKIHSDYYWWRNRLLWMDRNLSKKDKNLLWIKLIIPEISKVIKNVILKKIQKSYSKKDKTIYSYWRNRARLQGFLDYLSKRFGIAPSWISNPPLKR